MESENPDGRAADGHPKRDVKSSPKILIKQQRSHLKMISTGGSRRTRVGWGNSESKGAHFEVSLGEERKQVAATKSEALHLPCHEVVGHDHTAQGQFMNGVD